MFRNNRKLKSLRSDYIKKIIIFSVVFITTLTITTKHLHNSNSDNRYEIEQVFALETTSYNEEVQIQSKYSPEELDMLSRVIFAEAGSDYITNEHQLAVGSVVLNRIADPRFPNTMNEVVFQKGQYACIRDGNYYKTPNERAINNAKYLLENGVTIPSNVVWQSQRRQGKGLWKKIQNHYFCY